MLKKSTLLLSALFIVVQVSIAQSVITQWNFNSSPPDADLTTGSSSPSTGAGTLTVIGGLTASFASGAASGGSSDPAPSADNSGRHLTAFPAQATGDKTAGIQFAVSTIGNTNIIVTFDLRHSNTSAKHLQFQYTTDITAGSPVWVDFAVDAAATGDAWYGRSYNLSAITALNNNPNTGFRVVSTYAPTTTAYAPASSSSSYAAGGTWRFDMVTVKGSSSANVTFVGTKADINETSSTVNIVANLAAGNASPSSVEIEVLPMSTATSATDFTLPAPVTYNWPANSNNVTQSITVNINNDALPENTEYFVVRFKNAVNASLPSTANNQFTVFIMDDDKTAPASTGAITLNHIASFNNGGVNSNSAEIVAHDPASQRLFIANSIGAKLDIVNFSDPSSVSIISSISITPYGNINSVAVRNGVVACAVENSDPQLAGKVVFFDINGTFLNQVTVGAMPDMITFNNAGTKVLTANEGEPNAAYTTDPEGSVSVIDITGGIAGLTQANVTTVGFTSFNAQAAALKAAGVRIFGPGASVAQDMEPEYVALSADDNTAWIACQENNAIAVLNLTTNTITDIRPLGLKDHSLAGNALDINDQITAIQMANWPVKGVYMPDAMASFVIGGQTYLITANEGDSREYSGYSEVVRLSGAYTLDPTVFPNADVLKSHIGRLNVTKASGDTDNDGDFDEIHAYGARSFSIWNATTGALVWDSGDKLELITSKHPTYGAIFNASNANNTLKNRSDDKGPEPEGIAIAQISGRTFAFVALERIGGCMVFEVTDPANPVYVDYKNNRSTSVYSGDQGAEGIVYISAANSPTGSPIVILANEVSSTLAFYSVNTAALDIRLSDIMAVNKGRHNEVRWISVTEVNGDVYELERSKDGVNFSFIASISAKGFASEYLFNDEQPFNGLNYYRLKLKHISGSNSYSKTVTAFVKNQVSLIRVYPNPVKDVVSVEINNGVKGMIDIIGTNGSILKRVAVNSKITQINIGAFAPGIYTIRFTGSEQSESVTVTKQ